MRWAASAVAAGLLRAALAAFACLFAGLAPLLAQPLVPSGLAPGDHYHIAFVTSFVTIIDTDTSVPPANPSWGGVAAADYVVTDSAAAAGYIPNWNFTVTWKAVLSNSTEDARDHINVQGPVYNTRGELVATGAADLWDGTIAHAIQYDEGGGDIFSNFNVWTGTNSSGTWTTGSSWNNWDDPSGVGTTGNLLKTNVQWANSASLPGNSSARLYGISPLLTVPQPGDYNGDGTADAADYVVWRHRNGPPADYDLWRAHFGETLPASAASTQTAAVPEPSSFALLLVFTVILSAAKNLRRPCVE